jgi:hypothetical protein
MGKRLQNALGPRKEKELKAGEEMVAEVEGMTTECAGTMHLVHAWHQQGAATGVSATVDHPFF